MSGRWSRDKGVRVELAIAKLIGDHRSPCRVTFLTKNKACVTGIRSYTAAYNVFAAIASIKRGSSNLLCLMPGRLS